MVGVDPQFRCGSISNICKAVNVNFTLAASDGREMDTFALQHKSLLNFKSTA